QHTVIFARAGYTSENRTIEVASGSKFFLVFQLEQLTGIAAVRCERVGSHVFVDDKDAGKLTPAQISVDKAGSHTFLVRKQGYLEETSTANLQAGQVFHFAQIGRAS